MIFCGSLLHAYTRFPLKYNIQPTFCPRALGGVTCMTSRASNSLGMIPLKCEIGQNVQIRSLKKPVFGLVKQMLSFPRNTTSIHRPASRAKVVLGLIFDGYLIAIFKKSWRTPLRLVLSIFKHNCQTFSKYRHHVV